jgi:hypothetical protein
MLICQSRICPSEDLQMSIGNMTIIKEGYIL